MKLKLTVVAATAAALFCCTLESAFAELVVIDAKTPPCPIIVDIKDNPVEELAAKQLAVYLKKITGKDFEVKPYVEPIPQRAIVIGKHGNEPFTELGPDGFIIKTKGERLYIMGGASQGTAYGVFDFLQRELGCRWWSHTEEDVPTRAVVRLGEINVREKPAFAMHDIMSREAQYGANYFTYKIRAQSTVQFTGNHTLYPLLTEAANANPEFWPMNDKGVRAPNNLHFNYLAPGIAEALAVQLDKNVQFNKGNIQDFIYFAGQGDWYGGLDQSEASKKVYAEDGVAAPLIQMMNKTGAILDKKYPGIKVGTFAYMSTDTPPKVTVPARNVYIWFPRLRYGSTLGIEEGADPKNPVEVARENSRVIKERMAKWAKIAPGRFYVWEYGANYTHFLKPWPSLRAMAANIKFYKKIGAQGVMIQSNYVSFGGDLVVLKNWIWSHLMWNPNLKLSALLKEFCDGYYGPASVDMQDYVNALEDSVRIPTYMQLTEFTEGTPYLTPQVIAKMKAALKRAREKAQGKGNGDYSRRVAEAGASLEAVEIWGAGQLVEKDNRIVRADINGGEYTHPRALELLKNARGCGQNEWSSGIAHLRQMVSRNGGPLYVMKNGDVTAKIGPYQWCRSLWALLYKDEQVLEGVNYYPEPLFFETKGEPTNDKVVIEGERGYYAWHPYADHLQKHVYTQDKDGTLHTVVSYQKMPTGTATIEPLGTTTFRARDNSEAQKTRVEYDAGKGWQTLTPYIYDANVAPKLTPIEPATELEIRVTFPDRKIVVLDTIKGQPISGLAVAGPAANERVVRVYHGFGTFSTPPDQSVVLCEREFKVSSLP
jgi:hypothetical protein